MERVQEQLSELLFSSNQPSTQSEQFQDGIRAELGILMTLCKLRWPHPAQTKETIAIWFEAWAGKVNKYGVGLFGTVIRELVSGVDEFFPDPGKIEKALMLMQQKQAQGKRAENMKQHRRDCNGYSGFMDRDGNIIPDPENHPFTRVPVRCNGCTQLNQN